jgi:hypothetical protein
VPLSTLRSVAEGKLAGAESGRVVRIRREDLAAGFWIPAANLGATGHRTRRFVGAKLGG